MAVSTLPFRVCRLSWPTTADTWAPAPPPAQRLTDAAVGTREAGRTLASEPVDTIDADAAIVAVERGQASRGPRGRASTPVCRPPGLPLTKAEGCNRWCLGWREEKREVSTHPPPGARVLGVAAWTRQPAVTAPEGRGLGQGGCRRGPWAATGATPGRASSWRSGQHGQEPGCRVCRWQEVSGDQDTEGMRLRSWEPGVRGSTAGLGVQLCFGGQVQWAHPAWGQEAAGLGSPRPSARPCSLRRPTPKLTVCTGAALPAVSADTGEGVPAAHTGAPVHAGVGQAAVVLGCEGHGRGRGPVHLALDEQASTPCPQPSRRQSEPGAGAGLHVRGAGPVPGHLAPGCSPMLQVLPFQPGGQAQRKVSPLS